jgi:hypothetical protein
MAPAIGPATFDRRICLTLGFTSTSAHFAHREAFSLNARKGTTTLNVDSVCPNNFNRR